MTQRDDYVNNLLSLHIRYSQGWQRCEPDRSGYGDCSGVVCWASEKVGDSFGCTGSFALCRAGHAAGTVISIAEAKATKGAWVFQGSNGGQGGRPGIDPGHIGTSLGNGQTFEARGHIAGVGIFDFDSLRWSGACLPPHMTGFDTASSSIDPVESKGITVEVIDFVGLAANTKGGYWIARHTGQIYAYDALYHGGVLLGASQPPVVGIVSTPKEGYWMVATDGGVFAEGDAPFKGSMGGKHLNKPIVGIARTPSGLGYWLVASDGGIFSFGDAQFYGSTGSITLNQPIVGMGATSTGKGYWLVAADGGIFAYGDAKFHGGMGGQHLAMPIVGMEVTATGGGYWLVGKDGGIFSFGDAHFYGSMAGIKVAAAFTGIERTPTGNGYHLVASDGGVFSFGDAVMWGNPIGL